METVSISDLHLDRRTRVATWKGAPLQLGDRSFDTLSQFVERAPEMISKSELSEAVWPGQSVSDETVSQRVSLVRKAFKNLGDGAPVIKAVHGRGYVLLVPDNGDNSQATSVPDVAPPNAEVNRKPWLLSGLAALGAGVLALLLWPVEEPQVLINPETGDIWMGTSAPGPSPFPVRAQLDDRSVLINSVVSLSDLEENPVAQDAFCQLAEDRSLFLSTVPKELSERLDEATRTQTCR